MAAWCPFGGDLPNHHDTTRVSRSTDGFLPPTCFLHFPSPPSLFCSKKSLLKSQLKLISKSKSILKINSEIVLATYSSQSIQNHPRTNLTGKSTHNQFFPSASWSSKMSFATENHDAPIVSQSQFDRVVLIADRMKTCHGSIADCMSLESYTKNETA